MKTLTTLSLSTILILALASDGHARGGFSSGGGRGGFSSSRSFSSGRSASSRSYSAPSRTVTTTTVRRSGGYYGTASAHSFAAWVVWRDHDRLAILGLLLVIRSPHASLRRVGSASDCP